jgi:short-subunit dehydrogenase
MVNALKARLASLRDALRRPVPLRDKVVIVTGASSGIGRATAEAFAAEGARVALAARRGGELEQLAAGLAARGAEALPVAVDVTRDADLERLVAEARRAFGRIDVLVNNAGVAKGGRLHELDAASLHATLNVNLHGTFRLTQLVLPHLIEQGSGHIVNVSSVAAYARLPSLSVYTATKAAIVAFSSALRRELAGTGVHVSAVLPGATRTAMIADALAAYERPGGDQPAALKPLMQMIMGPEVPARAIVDAVRYRSREVLLGGPSVALVSLVEKLAPGLLDAALARLDPRTLASVVGKVGGAGHG